MEFENKKLRDVAEIACQIMVGEELKGGQKKIDKNHNGKIDGQDFAILRGQKAEVKKEEVEHINEGDFDNAKKQGWSVSQHYHHTKVTHPKHGIVSVDRYGEWMHHPDQDYLGRPKGDLVAHGQFKDLNKHLSSLKESVEPIEELSNATLRGYADKARTDIQKTLPKLHTDAKAAGRIDKRVAGLAASTVAKVKNNMKKEEVEEAVMKSDIPTYIRNAKGEKPSTVADVKGPRKDSISHSTSLARSTTSPEETISKITSSTRKKTHEEVDAAAATILEYESKDGKFVHRARPGAYGGTKDEKHAVDTLSGPKTKELKAIESEKKKKKFSEDLDLYKEGGIKGLFEAWAKKKKAMKEEIETLDEGIEVKKEYNDKTEAEHGVYHNGKKIGYVVHHKPSGTHTAYHSPRDDDDYGQIDDFHSHHDAVKQIRHSAGVGVHEEVEHISEEPTSAEFDAQLADAKQRAAGTKKQAEVSKPAVQAVQNEQTHTTVEVIDFDPINGVQHSEIDLEERQMTEPEMKKKEEIVKSMKKGMQGFKDRYGDRAKEVMYATATARAKGE